MPGPALPSRRTRPAENRRQPQRLVDIPKPPMPLPPRPARMLHTQRNPEPVHREPHNNQGGVRKPSKTKNIKHKSTPSSEAFKSAARVNVRKL
jgi:hypothetical protein